jgi:hypothetical protein
MESTALPTVCRQYKVTIQERMNLSLTAIANEKCKNVEHKEKITIFFTLLVDR